MQRLTLFLTGVILTLGFHRPADAAYHVLADVPLGNLSGTGTVQIAVDSQAHRVYVTDGVGKTVAIDGASNTVIATWPVGGIIAVNSRTGRVYVAKDDAAKVLDGESGAVLATYPLNEHPIAIAVDEGEDRLYALNGTSHCSESGKCVNSVYAYDGEDGHLLSSLALDDTYSGLAVNSTTHKVYVRGNPNIPVVEDNPLRQTHTLQVFGVVNFNIGYALGVDPDGGRVYVWGMTTYDPNSVSTVGVLAALDAATGQYSYTRRMDPSPVLPDAQVGTAPAVAVGRDRVLVASNWSSIVFYSASGFYTGFYYHPRTLLTVFNPTDGAVVDQITGIGAIAAAGEDPELGRFYALNIASGKLYVLGDAPSVDTTPPVITLTSSAPINDQGWVKGGTSTGITVHAEDDPGGMGVQAVSCVVDPGVEHEQTSKTVYGGEDAQIYVGIDRWRTESKIACLASDEAGNESRVTRTVRYDPTTPVTGASLQDGPEGREAVLKAVDPTQFIQVSQSSYRTVGDSGVAETRYRLDGGEFQPYTAPVPVPDDHAHTLDYYSTDVAGNVEVTHTLLLPITGDVNADGKVDVADVILTLEQAVGLAALDPGPSLAADMNRDGNIDVGDAILILRVCMKRSERG